MVIWNIEIKKRNSETNQNAEKYFCLHLSFKIKSDTKSVQLFIFISLEVFFGRKYINRGISA